MRSFQHSIMLLLSIFSCTSMPRQKNIPTATPQNKQVIIFDLTNVLIKENQIGFAKKIGYGRLANYAITHWKSPGYRCLDMLAEMSKHEIQKPHITITLQSRVMPRCLVELLDSHRFFGSTKEKKLMIDIMDLVLDPQTIASIIEPNKATVQLAQKLKKAGHPLYLCANAPEELYATAHGKFPDILQLFDGVVISSHVKIVKPDEAIFHHLLDTHNLDPAECILIDDLQASAKTAENLGIQAIVFDKTSRVTKKLKKWGIKI